MNISKSETTPTVVAKFFENYNGVTLWLQNNCDVNFRRFSRMQQVSECTGKDTMCADKLARACRRKQLDIISRIISSAAGNEAMRELQNKVILLVPMRQLSI